MVGQSSIFSCGVSYSNSFFINRNIDVLSGRLLSLEGVIKTFIFLDGAFVGLVARPLRQLPIIDVASSGNASFKAIAVDDDY